MPSKSPSGPLHEIRQHIQLASSFVEGYTFENFKADRRTVYATIRCLEIISEASRRLPDEFKARHPEIPWPNIATAGNVYRHKYEDVADDMVWRTIQESLGPLFTAVDSELRRA
jgi:uncharacterized protein with HEPN domain